MHAQMLTACDGLGACRDPQQQEADGPGEDQQQNRTSGAGGDTAALQLSRTGSSSSESGGAPVAVIVVEDAAAEDKQADAPQPVRPRGALASFKRRFSTPRGGSFPAAVRDRQQGGHARPPSNMAPRAPGTSPAAAQAGSYSASAVAAPRCLPQDHCDLGCSLDSLLTNSRSSSRAHTPDVTRAPGRSSSGQSRGTGSGVSPFQDAIQGQVRQPICSRSTTSANLAALPAPASCC